jgi:hypothetical protein
MSVGGVKPQLGGELELESGTFHLVPMGEFAHSPLPHSSILLAEVWPVFNHAHRVRPHQIGAWPFQRGGGAEKRKQLAELFEDLGASGPLFGVARFAR